MSHLTLSQLEQYLSKAAWILKGPIGASDFKAYIFPMLPPHNTTMRKRHISLKGTWEYSAPRLVKDGGLAVGQELALRREPDCKYDRNAVRAFAGRSKLGYPPLYFKVLSASLIH